MLGAHPVLAVMMTDPKRLWTAAELRVLCPKGNPASYLHFALKKGYVRQILTPSPSNPAGVSWMLVRLPTVVEEASANLKPPTNSPWGMALRLGEANPDAWFGIRELRHFFPNQSSTELRNLIEAGYFHERTGKSGRLEVKLRRLPTRSTLPKADREMLARAKRREADAKRRAKARAARAEAKAAQEGSLQAPAPAPAPPAAAPDPQEAEARRVARAAVSARRAEARQVLAGRICTYLDEHGPASPRTLHVALTESLVLIRQALGALCFDGQVAQVGTWHRTYQLVGPGLEPAPAELDAAACQVRALLAQRPNSEAGLVRASGLNREEVRGALSRLNACGVLARRTVGHLSIYRLEPALCALAAD